MRKTKYLRIKGGVAFKNAEEQFTQPTHGENEILAQQAENIRGEEAKLRQISDDEKKQININNIVRTILRDIYVTNSPDKGEYLKGLISEKTDKEIARLGILIDDLFREDNKEKLTTAREEIIGILKDPTIERYNPPKGGAEAKHKPRQRRNQYGSSDDPLGPNAYRSMKPNAYRSMMAGIGQTTSNKGPPVGFGSIKR